jgi:hypothetical protein
MDEDDEARDLPTWPGPSKEKHDAAFSVKINKIPSADIFWQGVGGGRIGLIFELNKDQSIGDSAMQEICRRVGQGPSSKHAIFSSKPDDRGTRTEKWTVNFHSLTELGKTFLVDTTSETSHGLVKMPCEQDGNLTEAAVIARVVPTTLSPTPHGFDVANLTKRGMNYTVKTLNKVKSDEAILAALREAKLFEASTLMPGAKLRAETCGAANMCYRTAAQMNGGSTMYSVFVFFKHKEVSKWATGKGDFAKHLTGEDAASENEEKTPSFSVRGRGEGDGPIDQQVKFIRGFQSGLYYRETEMGKGRGSTWGEVRRMEAGEFVVDDSGRTDQDLACLVTEQIELYRIGEQTGLEYKIEQVVKDLNMEPGKTSTGRTIPVSTIHFSTKELADKYVLKAQEEMRVNYSVIVVPGEEYHQVGKYTRLPEKFAQQQRGQLDHRGTAPAYQPLAGNYAAAVRGEGGGAAAAVENRLEVFSIDQRVQSRKMQRLEDTIRDVESRLVAQVGHLVTEALGNHLEKAVEKRMDAGLNDGLQSVLAHVINSEMDKKLQVATDRFLQKQRQETQDTLATQAAGLQAMEERMTAAMAAQTAAQTAAQAETQAAAQATHQLMAQFMQSQAARHGEGGLGLAKGDG